MAYDRTNVTAAAVLAAVVAEFALAAVDLPDRRYYTSGNVYYDAEQLSVTFVRSVNANEVDGKGTASQHNDVLRSLVWRVGEFEIMLLRCAPQIEVLMNGEVRAPKVSVQESYGVAAMADSEIIQAGLRRAARAGSFGEGPILVIGDYSMVGEGDLGGGALRCFVSLV